MATYAYRDKNRKDVIYASNAIEKNRNERFYCPNPLCDAHLHICAIDGCKKAYFGATQKDYPHIKKCSFAADSSEFNDDEFDESKFNFENAMANLFVSTDKPQKRKGPGEHESGDVKKHPPTTLRQIYLMCKSRPIADMYGNEEIGAMILDDRSLYRYPKGCFGNRIIEACVRGRFYDDKSRKITVYAPIQNPKYSFQLQFEEADEDVYHAIRKALYNNQEKIVVIAGKWEKTEIFNCFSSKCYGRKQIYMKK